ncbi:MAG: transcription termination/antitermination factor NusG [Phycisphaerales bacterium]|nr:MAG: transcription termination/antitermination factor NusG [Phycisphaerales bacterium]
MTEDQTDRTEQTEAEEGTVEEGAAAEGVQAAESSEAPAAEDQAQPEPGGEEQEGISLASREGMRWYVLRVASNKEDQVCQALSRKVKIEGLEERIGRILVPTQKEKRMRGGSVRVVERKLYPGYVFVEMATEEDGAVPENVWFMVKETTGVGDFIGSGGKPTPMRDFDVEKMLRAAERRDEQPGLGIPFKKGDRVKVREGSFENYEGDVDTIDEQKGMVTVLLTIFGRATPVDVEYWLLERV